MAADVPCQGGYAKDALPGKGGAAKSGEKGEKAEKESIADSVNQASGAA
jgi:hypothetical protein